MRKANAKPPVAVFGSSAVLPTDPEHAVAYEVGRLLGGAGFPLINGGYGGVMEASARGAKEAGGTTIGVTTSAFRRRGGANPFIDEEILEANLFDRTRRLIETAAAFIVLPGQIGTLAELAFLWALDKADALGAKPVILLGDTWGGLLEELRRLGLIQPAETRRTILVRSAREAVDAVRRSLGDI